MKNNKIIGKRYLSIMSTNTKMCYKAFVGCLDGQCKFAHSVQECKSEITYAMK